MTTSTGIEVLLVIASVVGGVLGLLGFVYLMALILDNYCCCCPWFVPVGDHTQEFDHGPVARKAGLWGLRRDERASILAKILVGTPYQIGDTNKDYGSTRNSNTNTTTKPKAKANKEKQKKKQKEDNTEPIEKDLEAGIDQPKGVDLSSHGIAESSHTLQDVDDAHHDTTCAICLGDYEQGDLVVTGRNCKHLFHKTCLLEWLEKNDHCPYCREEMVSAAEMNKVAYEVLGKSRVDQMVNWAASSQAQPVHPASADTTTNATTTTTTAAATTTTTATTNVTTTSRTTTTVTPTSTITTTITTVPAPGASTQPSKPSAGVVVQDDGEDDDDDA